MLVTHAFLLRGATSAPQGATDHRHLRCSSEDCGKQASYLTHTSRMLLSYTIPLGTHALRPQTYE